MKHGKFLMYNKPTLKNYIDASNSLIFLKTTESDRVSDEIVPGLFTDTQVPVTIFEWKPNVDNKVVFSSVVGGKPTNSIHLKLKNASNYTLGAWLSTVSTYDPRMLKKAPLALIIHNPDLAASLLSETGSRDNSLFYPMLAETAKQFRFGDSYIFLAGSSCFIPSDLEEIITVYDVPLPNQEELCQFFRMQLIAMKKSADAPIKLPKGKQAVTKLLNDAANAALGLGYHGAEAALSLSLAMYSEVCVPVIYNQKAAKVANSDVLELIHSDESEKTLAGFDSYLNWLNKRKDVFTPEARAFGLPYPKGVLITGIPGTGKSTAAKMTANYLNLPLIRLDIGKLYRSLLGASEEALRNSLKTIEAISPVVVWLEEIEKVLTTGTSATDGGVSDRIMATLLHWRQETTAPVFFVATANDIDSLPPALYRSERFDKIWGVELPDKKTRSTIFGIHLTKFGKIADFSNPKVLELFGEKTAGFSGAEIRAVLTEAMFTAWSQKTSLTAKHIHDAISTIVPMSVSRPDVVESFKTWADSFDISYVS